MKKLFKSSKLFIILDIIVIAFFGIYLGLNLTSRNSEDESTGDFHLQSLRATNNSSGGGGGSNCTRPVGTILGVGIGCSGCGLSKSESYSSSISVSKLNSSCSPEQNTSGVTCNWTISGASNASGSGFSIPIPSASGSGCSPATYNISVTCSNSLGSVTQTGSIQRYPGNWPSSWTSGNWTYRSAQNTSEHGQSCTQFGGATTLSNGNIKYTSRRSRCACPPPPPVESDPTVTTYHYQVDTTNDVPGCTTPVSQTYTKGSDWTTSACSPSTGWNYVSRSDNWQGTNIQSDQSVYYYYRENFKVNVYHLKDGTNEIVPGCTSPVSSSVAPAGSWTSSACTPSAGWNYSSRSDNWEGTNIQADQNIYYYYKENYDVTVYHLKNGTEENVPGCTSPVTTSYTPGSNWSSSACTPSSGWSYSSKSDNWEGTNIQANQTIYYYYKPYYTVTINHLEVDSTDKQVADPTILTIEVGTTYNASTYIKATSSLYSTHNGQPGSSGAFEWNGSTPSNVTGSGTVGENIIVNFYYRETSLIVHYCLVGSDCSDSSTTGQVHADDKAYLVYGQQYGSDPRPTNELNSPYTNVYEWNHVEPSNRYGTVSDSVITSGAGTAHQKIETTYYYFTTTLIVHHCIYGTTCSDTNTTNQVHADNTSTVFYGSNYSTSYYGTGSLNTGYAHIYEWNKSTPSNASGTVGSSVITSGAGTSSQVIEVTYYYRKTTLIVHHYMMNKDRSKTTTQVHDDNTTVVFYGNNYSTAYYLTGDLYSPTYKNRYEWSGDAPASANSSVTVPVTGIVGDAVITGGAGTSEQTITVSYYYILRPARLTIRHFIVGTTTSVCNQTSVIFNGTTPRLTDPYTANPCDLAANNRNEYKPSSVVINQGTGNINGLIVTGTHTVAAADGGTIVTYYYELKKTKLSVFHYAVLRSATGTNYLAKTTTKVHADDITDPINYLTEYDKNGLASSELDSPTYKDRYVYKESLDELINVNSKTGVISTDNPTIKFYYEPKPSKLKVRYYKAGTETRVPGVTQDYEYTNNILYDDKFDVTELTHKTGFGSTWINNETPGVAVSNLYKLDSITITGASNTSTAGNKATGTFNSDEVVVTFYYVRRTATLKVNHLKIENGVCGPNNAPNAVSTTETIYVGDAYTVSESPDVISIYTFDHSEGDPVHVTNIVENRVYTVNMCYKVREASVTSRYLICDADRQVGNNNPVTEQVPYETTYNGQRKTIAGYVYKGVRNSLYPNDPDKGDPETGRVIKGEYRIDYCYLRQYTLKVKHVDRDTGTVLQTNPDVILEEGQSFTTSRITREGYIDEGVEGPTEGRAQSSLADGNGVINVTYYYRRVFTLTVKHLRKTDREKLIEEDDVTRDIPYGQQYFKYHLDIESYYPDGVEGNAIGTITGDTTVIFLYSPVMYDIIEKYVDCDSKSVLHQEKWSQSPYLSEPEYSKIDIANYSYQAVETDAEHSTLNQAAGTAKVKIEKEYTTITYCYRQKEAKLIVNHLEDGTNRVLAPQEVTTGLKWGNTYNTSKKTIENYSKSRDSGNTSGTVGASSVNANNEIVVTYWYQQNRGSLTVRYTECSSDRVIHAPNEFAMNEGASYDTRPYKLEIPYYQYERVTGDETGTIHGDVVVTYCYRRLSGHLTVIYKDAVTHEEIADRTSLDWTLGETYNTIPYIKTIDNYASPPVSHEGQETGTMGNPSSDVEVTYYYDKSKVELIVKYVDMDTNTEFPNSQVVETKNYGDRYTTTQKSFQYYHFVRVDKPESGYIYQRLIVTYYYRRDKGIVRTYYRDIETQEEIAKREEEEKWYEEHYDTVRKEIPKYDYVEVEGTPSGTLLEDEVTVTYKYRKQRGSVIVSHINRATGAKFVPDETTVYKLDEHYETSSREFENFELVATPDNYVGVVTTTEPIHVNYYYDQLKGVVITRYKDEDTKEELLPTSRQGYNYGETYSTIKREVDNYHYTRTAGIEAGVVGEELIEVTYFYRRNIGTLTVEHIDAVTGRDLLEPRVEEYPYGTPYSTHREIFENYEYVRVTGNETGTIYGDVEVKYYYRTKDALLTINYLEDGTGNVLKTREVYNVKWGDAYSVSPVRIENFEYVRSDGDAERGTINGDKVINYYYKRIEANLIVHHLEYGTERILANEDREIVYYGLDYSTSSKEIEGYKMVATDGDDTHGVVSKKKIEVTYYYDRREAEVITLYLEQGTNNELSNSERVGYNFGDTYVTNAREITNYELVDHEGDLTGKVTQEITYVTYYYAKKKGTVTIKYLDESDLHYLSTGEPDDENPIVEEKEYGDTYTSVEKTFEDYELSRIEGNPEGTVDGDVIVIYYYKKREGRVVAKYLELLTNTELHSETVTTHKYGESYQTVKQSIKDYDFVMVDGEEEGTVRSPEIVVTYYYQKKNAHIISRYVEEGTNKQLATPQEQIVAYGKYYTTTSSGEVPENYELVRKTDNYEGIARQEEIEVYYYYRKKDSQLETKITKEGTDEITSRDEEVSYEINYEAIITDYIGKATVTIVDTLPYKLDTSYNNVLHGGVYNEYKNTIEWTEEIENFNSYDNDQLLITKNITVKYKDVEATERTMVNTVTGKIKLSNNVKEVENNFITRISIPGTIIVHHYIKGTTEELFPTEITEGLVGETYISHEQSLEGYKVVTKPANETHTFIEGELEVIYEYERIKFELDVEVIGGVGEITGEEEIFYGDDSTPENIVITPGEGYEIVKIMVNGVEYEITDPDGMILDNFINVQEDIIVQVTFDLKPITVPITGSNSKLVIIASILVILSGLVIAFKTGFITKLLKR